MISIKIILETKERENFGVLKFQLSYNDVNQYISTGLNLHSYEWDEGLQEIIINESRRMDLLAVRKSLELDMSRLKAIVKQTVCSGNIILENIEEEYNRRTRMQYFSVFAQDVISQLRQEHKLSTADKYNYALVSFMNFLGGVDIVFNDISNKTIEKYEEYLMQKGLTLNTISFYLRIIRALYNRAVDQKLCQNKLAPFGNVYTGVELATKRSLTKDDIIAIQRLELGGRLPLEFARDMFLFAFYTRGMSFVDIIHLQKTDIDNNMLVYRKRKVGQVVSIRYEECMEQIIAKYKTEDKFSKYIFPIFDKCVEKEDYHKAYRNALFRVNSNLKKIGAMLELPIPLTMYVARHSWASVAQQNNVPLQVISEGMGHSSEAATQIYLSSFENAAVDDVNQLIIGSVLK